MIEFCKLFPSNLRNYDGMYDFVHCTEVHFANFLSGGFITATLVNPPERKLAKQQCWTKGRSSTAVAEDLRPTATATVAEV